MFQRIFPPSVSGFENMGCDCRVFYHLSLSYPLLTVVPYHHGSLWMPKLPTEWLHFTPVFQGSINNCANRAWNWLIKSAFHSWLARLGIAPERVTIRTMSWLCYGLIILEMNITNIWITGICSVYPDRYLVVGRVRYCRWCSNTRPESDKNCPDAAAPPPSRINVSRSCEF